MSDVEDYVAIADAALVPGTAGFTHGPRSGRADRLGGYGSKGCCLYIPLVPLSIEGSGT